MKAGFNIGAAAPKKHVENVAGAIERIFRAAFDAHADQETVCAALQTLAQTVKVENVTIQHCTVRGDNTVRLDMDEPQVAPDR